MNITITIPDDKEDAVMEAFAIQYKYSAKIQDNGGNEMDNPISKGEFALNTIKSFIKDVYIASKVKEVDVQRDAVVQSAAIEADVITVS